MKLDKPTSNTHSWAKYAGLAGQMLASLALAIWLGNWLDGKTGIAFPIFALTLPLLVLVGLFWQLIKETTPRNKKNNSAKADDIT